MNFVDTSAWYALLDRDDAFYPEAAAIWHELMESNEPLFTSNYVLVETHALVQRRLGTAALRALVEDLFPVASTRWIDEATHNDAVLAQLTANRRGLSLVDCSSFVLMRALGVKTAFANDKHFAQQGFVLLGT